ncbi:hypothetical protein [Streptomyces sp. 769]|uniref:hypothetical protein n=1 Tax=Streptomyces sp. 769 TaxID=1262452 RepID=UPI00131AA4CD|nr:hypothetical protein [Streptomyces sp. 769]
MSELLEGSQYLIKNKNTGLHLTGKLHPNRDAHRTVEIQPLQEREEHTSQLWELRQGNAQGRFMLRNMQRRQSYLHPSGTAVMPAPGWKSSSTRRTTPTATCGSWSRRPRRTVMPGS